MTFGSFLTLDGIYEHYIKKNRKSNAQSRQGFHGPVFYSVKIFMDKSAFLGIAFYQQVAFSILLPAVIFFHLIAKEVSHESQWL